VRLTSATLRVLDGLADRGDASDRSGGWCYGYELLGATGLKSGSLYPILMRLAERGLLDAAWEEDAPPGRPPRHLYRLSPTGREWVRQVSATRAQSVRLRPAGAT
jgi:DNA-binding PadR family transcriptional regulator